MQKLMPKIDNKRIIENQRENQDQERRMRKAFPGTVKCLYAIGTRSYLHRNESQ
jgi:hypothetical protein